MTLYELCEKSVVNLSTGACLGRVDDLVFSPDSAVITHLVIFGKPRFFGLLGRGEDTRIEWQRIRTIGADVVLVDGPAEKTRREAKIWSFGGT